MCFVSQGTLLGRPEKMQRYYQDEGHSTSIELLGAHNCLEMPVIMRAADALIFPSYREGMPTVALKQWHRGNL
jgi:glycosyltransferase involved in cell wall biosynthesis